VLRRSAVRHPSVLEREGEIEVVHDPDDDSLARESLTGTGTR
jgi:hypothetical protein